MAVANRETRARIEKVNASAVKMCAVLGKDGMAGGLSDPRKGVDSSAVASSCSSAGGQCEGVCDVEDPGMLQARCPKKWQSKRYGSVKYRQAHANEGGSFVFYRSSSIKS